MPINPDTGPVVRYDKGELRERLDPVVYQVTQEKGTERPYTNKYYKHYESGTYTCVVCDEHIFASNTKYESGSGWPSFYDIMSKEKVKFRADSSGVGGNLLRIVANPHLIRTEVSCSNCGSHLGHIFDDGPLPTGKRYCVNSSSLNFVPNEDEVDGVEEKKKSPEILKFPARINGCGADGFCTRKPKQSSPSKMLPMGTSSVQDKIQDKEAKIQKEKTPTPEPKPTESNKDTTKEWSPSSRSEGSSKDESESDKPESK